MSLRDYIKTLQAKPYQERTRILWTLTAVTAVILLGIWIGLIKLQNAGNAGQSLNLFGYFTNLVENAKSELSQFQDRGGTQVSEAEIILKNFSADNLDKTLTVAFTVTNNGTDILNFPGDSPGDITLADGSKALALQKITGPNNGPFPKKILSKSQVSGKLVFPLPANKLVTIKISNLSFMQNQQSTFAKTLTLDITSRNVRGLFDARYPRD